MHTLFTLEYRYGLTILKTENGVSMYADPRKGTDAEMCIRDRVEETYIFPMLGGRNIANWQVNSNEYILVPDVYKRQGLYHTTINAPRNNSARQSESV